MAFVLSEVACSLRHPNVLSYLEFVVDGGAGTRGCRLIPVMEALRGPDLFGWLKSRQVILDAGEFTWLNEEDVAGVAAQMFQALHYLHSQSPRIVHRDVKPENLRFADDPFLGVNLKLVDFGLAHVDGGGAAEAPAVGTALYAAPEAGSTAPCPALDAFSAGAVLFLLLAGRFAHAEGAEHAGSSGAAGAPWHLVPLCTVGFVRRLLDADPMRRPTAKQVLDERWFRDARPTLLVPPVERVDTLRFFSALSRKSPSAL